MGLCVTGDPISFLAGVLPTSQLGFWGCISQGGGVLGPRVCRRRGSTVALLPWTECAPGQESGPSGLPGPHGAFSGTSVGSRLCRYGTGLAMPPFLPPRIPGPGAQTFRTVRLENLGFTQRSHSTKTLAMLSGKH